MQITSSSLANPKNHPKQTAGVCSNGASSSVAVGNLAEIETADVDKTISRVEHFLRECTGADSLAFILLSLFIKDIPDILTNNGLSLDKAQNIKKHIEKAYAFVIWQNISSQTFKGKIVFMLEVYRKIYRQSHPSLSGEMEQLQFHLDTFIEFVEGVYQFLRQVAFTDSDRLNLSEPVVFRFTTEFGSDAELELVFQNSGRMSTVDNVRGWSRMAYGISRNNRVAIYEPLVSCLRTALNTAVSGREDELILDVGAADGFWYRALDEKLYHHVVSFDFMQQLLIMARNTTPGIQCVRGDWGNLPFEDNTFAVVVGLNALSFIRDRDTLKRFLIELDRVAKPVDGQKVVYQVIDKFGQGFCDEKTRTRIQELTNQVQELMMSGQREKERENRLILNAVWLKVYNDFMDSVTGLLKEFGYVTRVERIAVRGVSKQEGVPVVAEFLSGVSRLRNRRFNKVTYDPIRGMDDGFDPSIARDEIYQDVTIFSLIAEKQVSSSLQRHTSRAASPLSSWKEGQDLIQGMRDLFQTIAVETARYQSHLGFSLNRRGNIFEILFRFIFDLRECLSFSEKNNYLDQSMETRIRDILTYQRYCLRFFKAKTAKSGEKQSILPSSDYLWPGMSIPKSIKVFVEQVDFSADSLGKILACMERLNIIEEEFIQVLSGLISAGIPEEHLLAIQHIKELRDITNQVFKVIAFPINVNLISAPRWPGQEILTFIGDGRKFKEIAENPDDERIHRITYLVKHTPAVPCGLRELFDDLDLYRIPQLREREDRGELKERYGVSSPMSNGGALDAGDVIRRVAAIEVFTQEFHENYALGRIIFNLFMREMPGLLRREGVPEAEVREITEELKKRYGGLEWEPARREYPIETRIEALLSHYAILFSLHEEEDYVIDVIQMQEQLIYYIEFVEGVLCLLKRLLINKSEQVTFKEPLAIKFTTELGAEATLTLVPKQQGGMDVFVRIRRGWSHRNYYNFRHSRVLVDNALRAALKEAWRRVSTAASGELVLDIGAGGGFWYGVVDRGDRSRIVSFDFMKKLLSVSKEHFPEISLFVRGDWEYLPYPDGSFGVVTGLDAVSFIADREILHNVLSGIDRVTKPVNGKKTIAQFIDRVGGGFVSIDRELKAESERDETYRRAKSLEEVMVHKRQENRAVFSEFFLALKTSLLKLGYKLRLERIFRQEVCSKENSQPLVDYLELVSAIQKCPLNTVSLHPV
ncbi:MAG: class I SAM-dependent methyltransferase, partial [Candidatus Omnitrophota bacterium]